MFLLMALGYTIAVSVLVSEIVGGCAQHCRQFVRRKSSTVISFARYPSKRQSVISIENLPPSNRSSFSENLRRRFSVAIGRKLSDPMTDGGLAIKNFFKRKSNVSTRDEEKADNANEYEESPSHQENKLNEPNLNQIDQNFNDEVVDTIFVENDGDSSSDGSGSHPVHGQHIVQINITPAQDREDNASSEFGEIVKHNENNNIVSV